MCKGPAWKIAVILALSLGAAPRTLRGQNPPDEVTSTENTVQLPAAAHKKGQAAGFYVDPITANRVYRLSDSSLCPHGANHFYSYTNQFSSQGKMVFTCAFNPSNKNLIAYPIYGPDFTLLIEDAASAARAGSGGELGELQWSQTREVLFARRGAQVLELDPFGHSTKVVADFAKNIRGVTLADGRTWSVELIRALSVGPGDRLLVHLICRGSDDNHPGNRALVGVGTFDPASGKYFAAPVQREEVAGKFDEAQWSQNPVGRVILIYANRPTWSAPADLSEFIKLDDNHGHSGYFLGSNGRSYRVSVKNDTLTNADGGFRGVGQIGCADEHGKMIQPWRPEFALYDDLSGKRVLTFGCEMSPATNLNPEHFSRSIGVQDVFAGSGKVITQFVLEYENGVPARIRITPVAYTRTSLKGCGYWAQPRAAMDHTGTRYLFDSSANNSRWAAVETDGKPKNDCRTDVFVAVFAPSGAQTPASAPNPSSK